MGKALIVSSSSAITTGTYGPLSGNSFNATESQSTFEISESCTLTNLRCNITSGGSGSNTTRLRKNAANGNLVATRTGVGLVADTSNSDSLVSGDDVDYSFTSAGTAPAQTTTVNVEFASGHGNYHYAASAGTVIMDVASSTRYIGLAGALLADGAATETDVSFKNRAYTSIEAFQVNVVANARVNSSTFKNRINAADGTGLITVGSGLTGLFTDTAVGDSLSAGDLLSYSMALGTGVEDMRIGVVGGTFKSSVTKSEAIMHAPSGSARTASATPTYFRPGGNITTSATEADVSVTPGFAATCMNLRCYVSANTYSGSATLKLMVNGAAQITLTISAGATGWLENTSDTFVIDDNDTVSFEVDEGTANSATFRYMAITFENATPPAEIAADAGSYTIVGTAAGTQFGRAVDAAAGSYALTGGATALEFDRLLGADSGSYVLTGSDVALEFDRLIDAAAGAYVLTGSVAALEYGASLVIGAEAGSYLLSGTVASLEFVQLPSAGAEAFVRIVYGMGPHPRSFVHPHPVFTTRH